MNAFIEKLLYFYIDMDINLFWNKECSQSLQFLVVMKVKNPLFGRLETQDK